jgi:hypothetical protein
LSYEDDSTVRQFVMAQVTDLSDAGMGVLLRHELSAGLMVTLKPSAELAAAGAGAFSRARVRWCRPHLDGAWAAGLEFVTDSAWTGDPGDERKLDLEDYYEILQVSPKAEPDTIHRVYRILAQRLHPDNRETGSETQFKIVTAAYQVLGDPQRRAAYDASRQSVLRERWRVFHKPGEADGAEAEIRKRKGILAALYRKRMMSPESAWMRVAELEDLLGVPREHLEFTLWYVKGRGLVTRSDNGRYEITIEGVDWVEAHELPSGRGEEGLPLRIPAPAAR